ncbi:MbnP family protein [Winogradskyella poriferorum]|uniref:MbnP family protein n=1 Tax=Winogradskyella poriferorum TaxID=307627 RepID=A0ABU7W2B1_9FLAO
MKKTVSILCLILLFISCNSSDDSVSPSEVSATFKFTHNWNGALVRNFDFGPIQYVNENGESIGFERLRYVISDIIFTKANGEEIELDVYNLVDLTNEINLEYTPNNQIPTGNYTNVSFTFGLDNEDNAENYTDLNSASFNVPEMMGGGYHYMQFDGKFINSNNEEQGFNYHAIRAVDNLGANPTFPQDTFFTVNLGAIAITNDVEIEVKMNIAEWFSTPNLWDLNIYNQTLMPNSTAQIMMYENGQNVFSLGDVIQ